MSLVRRLVSSLVCLAFAATLQASVPRSTQVKFDQQAANTRIEDAGSGHALPMTAAPADRRSFYAEFYPSATVAGKAHKSGLLRRFTGALKKTAQKVNFFN
jgi:hypothetical protein